MIAPWASRFVGIPYRDRGRDYNGADCWGLVWLVYRDHFGLNLPHYADAYETADDHAGVTAAIADGLKTGWDRVQAPSTGTLCILRVAGRPWHCGLVVGQNRFLHVMPPGPTGIQ